MLGLCWSPSTIQGMQKMATSMPSNPEQLLGAILVRKDIFHRFETTMHDTCLDANNLLEYLFSLYNRTAAPAERDSLSLPQVFGFTHRDLNLNKKGTGHGQHALPLQSNIVNSHLPQPTIQGRVPNTSSGHHSVAADRHRKKIKLEQPNFQRNVNFAAKHQGYDEPVSLKSFDSQPVFPGTRNIPASIMKIEQSPEVKSHQVQSLLYLPPLSHIHHDGSKPYSPASTRCSDALTTPPHEDSHQNVDHSAGVNTSGDVKFEIEGALQGVLRYQQTTKDGHRLQKHIKKVKLKGSNKQPAEGLGENFGERIGRKRRIHQCFCGAVFTRADNLKRHIRKCHEEKLSDVSLGLDIDNNNTPAADFSQGLPSPGQEVVDLSQPQDSHDPQPKLSHHHQQEDHHQQHDSDSMKCVATGDQWSCFCGQSFADPRHLVEHTRTHCSKT